MTKTDIANLALSKIGESLIDDLADTGSRSARLATLHYDPSLREALRAHFWGFAMATATATPKISEDLLVSGNLVPDVTGVYKHTVTTGILGTFEYWMKSSTVPHQSGVLQKMSVLADNTWYLNPATSTGDYGAQKTSSAVSPVGLTDWTITTMGASGQPVISNFAIVPDGWGAAFDLPADFIKLRRLMSSGEVVDKFDFRRVEESRCLVAAAYDSLVIEYVQYLDDPTQYDPLFIEAFATLLACKLARAVTGSEAMENTLRQLYEANALPAARTADGHDSQSNENHPLKEMLDGSLLGRRGDFFHDRY